MFLSRQKKPVVLVILDGWGVAPSWGGNAISQANTKFYDKVWQQAPKTTLLASGEAVGLPVNSPGNSEAGHLNIGAGHVVHQDQTLIDAQIDNQSFFKNPKILKAIEHATQHNSNIHLMGLLSKTGTHSHIKHLYALLSLFKSKGFPRVFIHLFSDGRDSDPMSGIEMVDEIERKIAEIGIGKISSITGRFYAMDRDNRWGRVARAYNLLVKGEGNVFESPKVAITSSYSQGITDEFIEPRLISNKGQQIVTIKNNDSIIFFNFRSDRAKEITRAFLDEHLPEFPDRMKLSNLYFATFVIYDDRLLSEQIFSAEKIVYPLARVFSENNLKQLHAAETEKYPHVTYFLNGGTEKPFPGESRVMVPSPQNFKTYDYVPRMNANKLTSLVASTIKKNIYDFIVVNFANTDMVGHTGNLGSAIISVECIDESMAIIANEITNKDGLMFIVGDHGNVEQMINPQTGDPDTEHTTNPVPFIIVSNNPAINNLKLQADGILASVSPTILDIMQIKKPVDMRNNSIIIKEINVPTVK